MRDPSANISRLERLTAIDSSISARRGSIAGRSAANIGPPTTSKFAFAPCRVSEAITAVTEAGANLVNGPTLVVSDREAANKSAYAMAYEAARTRADAYAEAAGLEVSRVLTIRDGGGYATESPMVTMDAVMTEQAAAPVVAPPPPPFNPGMNRSQFSVTVSFALREK